MSRPRPPCRPASLGHATGPDRLDTLAVTRPAASAALPNQWCHWTTVKLWLLYPPFQGQASIVALQEVLLP